MQLGSRQLLAPRPRPVGRNERHRRRGQRQQEGGNVTKFDTRGDPRLHYTLELGDAICYARLSSGLYL